MYKQDCYNKQKEWCHSKEPGTEDLQVKIKAHKTIGSQKTNYMWQWRDYLNPVIRTDVILFGILHWQGWIEHVFFPWCKSLPVTASHVLSSLLHPVPAFWVYLLRLPSVKYCIVFGWFSYTVTPCHIFNALLVPDKLIFPLPFPCPRKLKINFNFLMEGYGCFVWLRGKKQITIVWWNYRSAGEFLKLVKLHSNLVTWPHVQRSVPESTAEVSLTPALHLSITPRSHIHASHLNLEFCQKLWSWWSWLANTQPHSTKGKALLWGKSMSSERKINKGIYRMLEVQAWACQHRGKQWSICCWVHCRSAMKVCL